MLYKDLKGYKYMLEEPVFYQTNLPPCLGNKYLEISPSGVLKIRMGYCWDGPSGPTFDTKTFMLGSLVHDALYQLMREQQLDTTYRAYADQLLHDICVQQGMCKFRAWYVHGMVESFGARHARPLVDKKPRHKEKYIVRSHDYE